LFFGEYFDEMRGLQQALLPHGVVTLFNQALSNIARLIGGIEYAMTVVSRI
jgi:hypothetical protein